MNNNLGDKLIDELFDNPLEFYNKGKSLQLLEECFNGFSLETLLPLFSHENLYVRRAAIWIASELGSKGTCFIDNAIALLKDDDRYVKHYALEVIAVCSIGENLHKFINVVSFLECEDEILDDLVMMLISNANKYQLEEGVKYYTEKETYNKLHYEGLTKLIEIDDVTREQVELMLKSDEALVKKYGNIIAKKKFSD